MRAGCEQQFPICSSAPEWGMPLAVKAMPQELVAMRRSPKRNTGSKPVTARIDVNRDRSPPWHDVLAPIRTTGAGILRDGAALWAGVWLLLRVPAALGQWPFGLSIPSNAQPRKRDSPDVATAGSLTPPDTCRRDPLLHSSKGRDCCEQISTARFRHFATIAEQSV